MAMLPFCGYNMADYFRHWLAMGRKLKQPPPIFHVNWFRTDRDGNYLWPGFGENLRVLQWIIERSRNEGAADETPIGSVPTPNAILQDGLELPGGAIHELLHIDRTAWTNELTEQQRFFDQFGDRQPQELSRERDDLAARLTRAVG